MYGGDGPPGSCYWGDTVVEAFHVEIDTWQNTTNGDECHTDPTPENHIAVMAGGNPAEHLLWAEVPSIEDNQWHQITVDVTDSTVVVTLDGSVIINDIVTGFEFRCGFIGFSGTTGYYTNYRSFDNLQILQDCPVP